MFSLFRSEPLLDEASIWWLFDVYAWALKNFGSDVFYQETVLVVPTNEHFPGREQSVHGMAQLIFEQVRQHAGLSHWPARLVEPERFDPDARPRLALQGAIRGGKGISPEVSEGESLVFTYDPNLIGNPQALIATFVHNFAHFLGSMADEEPPGGRENWPHLTEVLGVFMGFGLMLANSAFKAPAGGCGSCAGPAAERTSFLSQYDMTYALALFAVLKGIPNKEVLRHLKKPLRPFFKRAVKDIKDRADALEMLQGIDRRLPEVG
ncbi:hypothetical protein [Thiohalomonas denitrificans]|uniref:Uncharacterized protein n=1 Tax=Thiohalomonas denitrificans TaxID=415747 RepID=A0A1G5QRF8_9GAMM|nr:hypothetical protein [Thiohalomonas denitrificans]SCZ64168.1 hypothetical protein SAMN03097708_02577 [Thiohalomonas denitrificans]